MHIYIAINILQNLKYIVSIDLKIKNIVSVACYIINMHIYIAINL